MKKLKIIITLIIVNILTNAETSAQDSHYWTNQYGTEASLLGGLVVGSMHDLSSTFYNPGTLALTTDQILTISTDAFQITRINIDAISTDLPNLESSTSGSLPGIIAFRLPIEELGRHQLAFSVLTRDKVETDFYGRDINPLGANGVTANDGFSFQNFSERWFGISWGYMIAEKVGIGISQYVAVRSQRQRIQVINQFLEDPLTAGARILFSDVYFNNFKILWKAGIIFDNKPLSFGLTITTPSLNLFNTSADASLNISQISSRGEEQFIAANDEKELNSFYKSPLSIGAGAAYFFGNTSLYITAEWFASISQFSVLNTSPVPVIPNGAVIPNQNLLSRSSVFNYGLGVKHIVSQNFSIYGSVFKNDSSHDPNLTSKYSLSTYDILHILGGTAFKYKILDLILGFGYAFGNAKVDPLSAIVDPTGNLYVSEGDQSADVSYNNYKIVFAFSITI
ncbi:MAG: hypothetical protein JSW63_11640 [Ignavibacterium sp.]|nr:MAG: hypothetical protein JSW63_11640 [Ignavibacterium sp.]